MPMLLQIFPPEPKPPQAKTRLVELYGGGLRINTLDPYPLHGGLSTWKTLPVASQEALKPFLIIPIRYKIDHWQTKRAFEEVLRQVQSWGFKVDKALWKHAKIEEDFVTPDITAIKSICTAIKERRFDPRCLSEGVDPNEYSVVLTLALKLYICPPWASTKNYVSDRRFRMVQKATKILRRINLYEKHYGPG